MDGISWMGENSDDRCTPGSKRGQVLLADWRSNAIGAIRTLVHVRVVVDEKAVER